MIRPAGNTLLDWRDRYLRSRPLGPNSAYQVRRSVSLLIEWHGQAPDVREICEDLLSSWIMSLEGSHAPRSRQNHRANIVAILRSAASAR